MMQHSYSPLAFPLEFSRLVADATADLPPMTRPEDTAFLELALADVIDIFWANYIAELSADAKVAYTAAEEEETGDALYAWHKTYANFETDPAAVKRGTDVLNDIAAKLPAALKSEYETFDLLDAIA